MYSVIDLFAGAGGLSLGFCQTNKFSVKVAFENNKFMQATYMKNHSNVEMCDDVRNANYAEIIEKYGSIDVVIGGPPCQGFSNANRQKNSRINSNNMLIKEYVRAVKELHPQAFVLENVQMLKSKQHMFFLTHKEKEIILGLGIPLKEQKITLIELNLVNESIKALLDNYEMVSSLLYTKEAFTLLNRANKLINLTINENNTSVFKSEKLEKTVANLIPKIVDWLINQENKKNFFFDFNQKLLNTLAICCIQKTFIESKEILEQALAYQNLFRTLYEFQDNNIIFEIQNNERDIFAILQSYTVFDYLEKAVQKEGYSFEYKVLCATYYGAPQKRNRFIAVGLQKDLYPLFSFPEPIYSEDKYFTVKDAIEDLEEYKPFLSVQEDKGIQATSQVANNALSEKLRDAPIIKNHIITDTRERAKERFHVLKPGQNFHDLDEQLKDNYADAKKTQNSIYKRLQYDKPSDTVTNVRKAMWIHPTLDRAISIREAARLQTFPDSFEFCGTKDMQYQQVGNAVPPCLAYAIASALAKILDNKEVDTQDNLNHEV